MTLDADLKKAFPALISKGDELDLLELKQGSGLLSLKASPVRLEARICFALPEESNVASSASLRATFWEAVQAYLREHFSLEVISEREGEATLRGKDSQGWAPALSQLAEDLELMLRQIARGISPFQALGERDHARSEGGEAPPSTKPLSEEATPQPPPSRSAQAAFQLRAEDHALTLSFGLAHLPPWSNNQALTRALQRLVERRLGLSLKLWHAHEDSSLPSLLSHRATFLLPALSTPARAQLEGLFEKLVALINGGLGVAEVLDLDPPQQHPPRQDQGPALPPSPQLPLPSHAGEYDLHLLKEGYAPRRVHQLVALSLSIDIINARSLCEAAPVLLLPGLSQARAEELKALLKRAGGVVEITPQGSPPTRSRR